MDVAREYHPEGGVSVRDMHPDRPAHMHVSHRAGHRKSSWMATFIAQLRTSNQNRGEPFPAPDEAPARFDDTRTNRRDRLHFDAKISNHIDVSQANGIVLMREQARKSE